MKERDECKTSIVANFHRGMQIQTIYLHSHAYVCQDNQNIEAAILNLPNHRDVHQIEREPALEIYEKMRFASNELLTAQSNCNQSSNENLIMSPFSKK
jgi:hypothetical protein